MKRKIKDSNDFFGYLISIKNKDNNVVLGRISKDYGDSAIDDFIDYINELEEMKYIKINSLEDIHIVKSKEHNYISPLKKIIDYIHHDEEGHYESVTISEAYTEKILVGYRCSSCGETKSN